MRLKRSSAATPAAPCSAPPAAGRPGRDSVPLLGDTGPCRSCGARRRTVRRSAGRRSARSSPRPGGTASRRRGSSSTSRPQARCRNRTRSGRRSTSSPGARENVGCRTLLDLTGLGRGLPERQWLQAALLAAAQASGLTLAVVDPAFRELMHIRAAGDLLEGRDPDAAAWRARFG